MKKIYYNAKDVAELLQISQSKAYTVIRELNFELYEKGYLVIKGKIPIAYFNEKIYGATSIV